MAKCMAFRCWKKIPKYLVANSDHTNLISRCQDAETCFVKGVGNGGLKKKQGDRKTFTCVPLDFYGTLVGNFSILKSSAHVDGDKNKPKGRVFSKTALNTFKKLDLINGTKLVRDARNELAHVSTITCSNNG